MRAPIVLAALLLTASPAAAACDSYGFADSAGYSAARVKPGSGKIHFQDDSGVEQKAYLLPGDEVVVMASEAGRACAVYVSGKYDETIGWLPLDRLQPVAGAQATKGKFVRDSLGSEALLKPMKGGLVDVSLEAYWAMSLEAAQNGGINSGSMGDKVKPDDGIIHIAAVPEDNNNCEADLRLIGSRYLLVEDNRDRLGEDVLSCAGHNVTFTGLYVRTK